MNDSLTIHAGTLYKTLLSILSILVSSFSLRAQVVFYSENFNALADGTTSGNHWSIGNVGDCDSDGFTFEVQSGAFVVSDAEGVSCCDCVGEMGLNHCGNNANGLLFGPFDISSYCQIDLNFNANSTGVEPMECGNFSSVPYCDGQTDLITLRIFIDGAPINFPVCCGNNCNQVDLSFSVNNNDSLSFRILAGTQNPLEEYTIDNIVLMGTPGPTITAVEFPGYTVCEGDSVEMSAVVNGCGNCSYAWRDEDMQVIGDTTFVTIDSIIADSDGVNRYTFSVASGECVSTYDVSFNVYKTLPNQFIGELCQDNQSMEIDVVSLFETNFGITGIVSGNGVQEDMRTLMPFGLDIGLDTLVFTPEGNCESSLVIFEIQQCDPCDYEASPTCLFSATEGDLSSIVFCTFNLPDPSSYNPEGNPAQPVEIPNCDGNGALIFENPLWFTFTATNDEVIIPIALINCPDISPGTEGGVQYALLSNCYSPEVLACDTSKIVFNDGQPLPINVSGLEVGELYFLVIDGYNGSQCAFELYPFTGLTSGQIPPSESGTMVIDGGIAAAELVRGFVLRSPSGDCWFISINGNGDFQMIQVTCSSMTNDSEVEMVQDNLLINGAGQGLTLKSPDGDCYRHIMLDNGSMQKSRVNCEQAFDQSLFSWESGNLFINNPNKGIIMRSMGDLCWHLTVDETGQWEITQIICPI